MGIEFSTFLVAFVSNLYTNIWPGFFVTLIAAGAVLLLAIEFIANLVRRRWGRAGVACLAIPLSYWGPPPIGRAVADWQFKRCEKDYARVVDGVMSGTVACSEPCRDELSLVELKKYPPHVLAVKVGRCANGAVTVVFLTQSVGALLHGGYVYKGYVENDGCMNSRMRPEATYYVRHVEGRWYHFSDKPSL
jgi:hypothetical protein